MKNLRQRPQMKWVVMDMTQLTVSYKISCSCVLHANHDFALPAALDESEACGSLAAEQHALYHAGI